MTSTTYSYPVNDPGQPPASSGASGCLKFGCGMGLGLLALVMIAVCAGVMSLRNAYTWIEQGVQEEPFVFPASELTLRQRAEIGRLHNEHERAHRDGTELDVTLEPELFNAFVREEIERKKAEGAYDEDREPAGLEVLFQGNDTVFRISAPAQDRPGFYNIEVRGDPTIENGRFTGRIDAVKLADREAPWAVQKLIDAFVEKARQGQLEGNQGGEGLSAIKLLRREGEKVHLVIEAGRVPPPGEGD